MVVEQRNFKKWLALCSLALVLGIGLFLVQPAAAQTASGSVNAAALNVRSGPGVGYNAVSVVYQGYNVTLLERNSLGTWVKIRTVAGNIEGWVNVSFLTVSGNVSALPVTATSTVENTAVVNQARVNMRAGDTLEFVVVGTAGLNAQVAVLGRNFNSSWAYVRVISTGQEGWINRDYLTPNDFSGYPVVASPSLTTANSAAVAESQRATGSTAVVTAGNLNVRRGDGVGYQILTSVARDTAVTILARNSASTWAYIRVANGQEGWVNAFYLRYNPGIGSLPVRAVVGQPTVATTSATTSAATTTTTVTAVGDVAASSGIATINVDALFVRYGPGQGYDSFALVYRGDQLSLIGRNANTTWVKVQDSNGVQGWVASAYILSSVAWGNLPVVN